MAVTVANAPINLIGDKLAVQNNLSVDDLSPFAMELGASTAGGNSAQLGDTVKVPIYSATGDAKDWNSSTQNYSTVDGTQGVVFKDVAIDQRIIKTIEIDEMDLFKVDVVPLLTLELENVARTAVDRVMALVTPTNFATTITVGADTAFDASKVVAIRKEDQVRKYNSQMRKLALNVDYSIALQQDPVINNHNTLRPVDLPSNVILNSFSKFGGGLFESENMTSANNVVGFVTNGNGIAIATPSAYQSNDPTTTFEQTIVSYNGWDFLLRKTKDGTTGAVRFSIELQFGFAVADELGICPLVSA
jgi:hypothetical protein